jgi:hypothetical protein
VITEYMGGGFGAKFGAGNVGAVATHLSRKGSASSATGRKSTGASATAQMPTCS